MAGYFESPLARRIASLKESLERVQDEKWRRITIEVLPEDILLEIFDFYRLDAMKQSQGCSWKWHRLAHVCQKWRQVLSMSPHRLDLRILCERGAPIKRILAAWPTLPLAAKFNVGRKSKRIPRNVMLALHLPDRLCEIDLHVTSSMLASIVQVTQKPCQALKSIRITLTGPPILLHNAFLGGSAPHLREIKLDGIAFPFPSIRQVLLSTNNLVELHLGHIPNDAYFSPNDLATGLFASVQLERLTVDFHSPASSPPSIMTGRLSQRTTLPSLIFFDFHGASGYLEEFVAQIELPALCRIAIRFFNDIFFEIPQFYKFILRLNALRTPTRVIIKHNVDSVGVIFEEGQPLSENCFLGISCRQLDWQLSFVTEILSQLFPLLSSVQSLDIQSGDELPTGEEDVDSTQWLELLRPFTHVTQAYVWEKLVSGIVQALAAEDMTTEILPELTLLHLSGYRSSPQVAKVATQFVDTRRLSGRTISLISGDEEQEKARRWREKARQRQEQEKAWQEKEKARQEKEEARQVQVQVQQAHERWRKKWQGQREQLQQQQQVPRWQQQLQQRQKQQSRSQQTPQPP